MQKKTWNHMNRRELLKLGGLTVAGTLLEPTIWPLKLKAAGKANPRGGARNVVMYQICGAMSQWDTWDFKEQPRQPNDLDVRKTVGGIYLSKTLFPGLSDITDKVSFVRSMRASELVHFNAQFHTQAGRPQAPAIAKETPAFGSIISYELESKRRPTDTFPTYMSFNTGPSEVGSLGPGFLPPRFAGFDLWANKAMETFGSSGGVTVSPEVLNYRWNVLSDTYEMSEGSTMALGSKATDYRSYYHDAYKIMTDPRWSKVFEISEADRKRYPNDDGGYGNALLLTRNILAADAGTHAIYIDESRTWDQHAKIFDRATKENHYLNCLRLDQGLVAFITDLAKMPGHEPGKTLLDETMFVVGSEFGRTPEINPLYGRHHYRDVYTFMFAGGGVKGGRIIGSTDAKGKVADTGWKHKEQPFMDNALASMYSVLGIDWRKRIENTPSGRAYDYVQTAPLGASEFQSDDEIAELFV